MANIDKEPPQWHAMEAADVLARLQSDATQGLTPTQARERLAKHGPNRLPPPRRHGPLVRFLLQFHNILIYVLLVAGAGKLLLQEWVDASVIFGVVLINAFLGFVQEGKAEKALEAIRGLLTTRATVLRGGRVTERPGEELVPGDIVLLESGDKVPADLRLIETRSLRVEEAALTGESVPVEKETSAVEIAAGLGDRTCMTYSGTLVVAGRAKGVVVATGADTELGRINRMLTDVGPLETPLLAQIRRFAIVVAGVILVVSAAMFLYGVGVRGFTPLAMFKAAVGLAVAAIPEGLPAIITITLAIGVRRMAARNAIIRRLPAVETLGSVSRICSDKTGTLTRNEMTAVRMVTASGLWSVTGTGYAPEGKISLDAPRTHDHATSEHLNDELVFACRVGALCNDARFLQSSNGWSLEGDPTEGSLLPLAAKAGLNIEECLKQFPRVAAIPFESELKFMATFHRDLDGTYLLLVKGAPEVVLSHCSSELRGDGVAADLDSGAWQQLAHQAAADGLRVLALACKRSLLEVPEGFTESRLPRDLSLVALVGIIDPPRPEAIESVAECHSGGVRVTMITGDHAATAATIAAKLGIGDGQSALTGADLERMSDEELQAAVERVDVFARTTPEHKLRLVRAIRANGHVVAMTGDGVNDAPALKQADVGVAMGIKGTEVTKEAAEMVLADDNFASIAAAIKEGRTVYANIEKAILFILPTNGGQGLTILAAVLAGMTLPITAPQILWVNMVTAVTLALAFSFEPHDPDVMRRPPRDVNRPLLGGFGLWRVVFISALMLVVTFGTFWWMQHLGHSLELSRTAAVNALIMCQVGYLLNSRCPKRSSLHSKILSGNIWMPLSILGIVVLQLLFTYVPAMQRLFGTEALNPELWLVLAGAAVLVFLTVEVEKLLLPIFQRTSTKKPNKHSRSCV